MANKKLDDELAKALAEVDASSTAPAAAAVSLASREAHREPPKRSMGLLVALLVMVGAVVTLFMVGFKEAAIYALPVQDLVNAQPPMIGRKVRIEGELVPGTLVKRDSPCEYRFTVKGGDTELPVVYPQCVVPDTFRDIPTGGVQVTVEGALVSTAEFKATLVMAKCTSKYDPASHEMKDAAKGPLSQN